jgi:phosphatidylinositol alpha-1,6-mannosyltransferase
VELVFTGQFPPMKGGIGSYVRARCESPPRDGLRVLAPDVPGSKEWDAASPIDIRRFGYVQGGSLGLRAMQIWWAAQALRRRTRSQKYRLVTAAVVFPFGLVAVQGKRSGYRVAMFCHGAELLRANLSALGRWVFRTTVPGVDLLVANSPMTADTLKSLGCGSSRICVIPPPVAGRRFHPSIDGSSLRREWTAGGAAGPVLLTVCRLDDVGKGVDTVIRLLPRLRRRFPDIRYVVVGDGPTRAKYESLARETDVGQNTIFAGRVPDWRLPECYAACDAFVLLSRREPAVGYYEGFGIVYREAMACAKPVIVSREAGFRDFVVDGETGLLVNPREPEEVLDACVSVLSEPREAQRMGRRAAEFAAKPADWSALNDLV